MTKSISILFAALLFAVPAWSQTRTQNLKEELWQKRVKKTVDQILKTDKCKDANVDKTELGAMVAGDSSKAESFKGKSGLSDCLHAIHEELHGKNGVCTEDQSGYGVTWDPQCKKSKAAIRESFKRMNSERAQQPQAPPANQGDGEQ